MWLWSSGCDQCSHPDVELWALVLLSLKNLWSSIRRAAAPCGQRLPRLEEIPKSEICMTTNTGGKRVSRRNDGDRFKQRSWKGEGPSKTGQLTTWYLKQFLSKVHMQIWSISGKKGRGYGYSRAAVICSQTVKRKYAEQKEIVSCDWEF